ncbi:RNA methyltransferase, TrmH family, group 3 [Umbelopsis sp. PMI_123]|nr:RNA methyltransferase, TrmH family, group 3 [Umbelopsis sp. PMI_123]
MEAIRVRFGLLKSHRSFNIQLWETNANMQVRCLQTRMRDHRSRSLRSSSFPTNDLDHLFGQTSVLMALQNKKRRPKKLFIQRRTGESQFTTKRKDDVLLEQILKLAGTMDIPIIRTDKGELNNLTQNRPHQGIVLQATHLDTTVIQSLSTYDNNSTGSPPLWLALDEIQDPQNLGSILRTAYFFAVDGVVICTKNSAPLSNIVSRVSAGALECMDIHSTKQLPKFLQSSKQNGWTIIGAEGQDSQSGFGQEKYQNLKTLTKPENSSWLQRPRVLVLGNEGVGLRKNVQTCCDYFLGIDRLCEDNRIGAVDSLNVGVATGILLSHLKSGK